MKINSIPLYLSVLQILLLSTTASPIPPTIPGAKTDKPPARSGASAL